MTLRELRDMLTEAIDNELREMVDKPVMFATSSDDELTLLSIYDCGDHTYIDIGKS